MDTTVPESKGACQRCGEHFTFPTEMEGQDIDCPHCGKQTTLKSHESPPLVSPQIKKSTAPQTNRQVYILILVLAIVAAAFLIPAAIHRHQTTVAEEKVRAAEEARRQQAVDNVVSAIATMKTRTGGCTLAEFQQCETDIKTAYEINKPWLAPFSTDFERLTRLIGACELCWNNANITSMMGGTIYPKQPGVLDAMIMIDPNVTNLVDKPPYTTNYFNGRTFVRLGLGKISILCDSLLSKMQPVRQNEP